MIAETCGVQEETSVHTFDVSWFYQGDRLGPHLPYVSSLLCVGNVQNLLY